MTVTLRPLRDDEFAAWRARSALEYARSMTDHGGMSAEAADAKATKDFDTFLPDGLATKDHEVFMIEDGEPLGSLWVAERDVDEGRTLFVFELFISPEARGRGAGREAMLFAEEEAARRGIGTVSLNVFGGNDAARGLYRALAYQEVAVFMRKRL